MGPSNSGKSTLADAIARGRGMPAIHLDQFYHLPDTDWEPRPEAEFLALHEAAILGERWVIDGNYSRCMAERLARATGIILLDTSTATSLIRYLRRAWFERERHGALAGGRDSVKWAMLHHIAVRTRDNRRRYRQMFDEMTLPRIRLASPHALKCFYRVEVLSR